MQQSARVVVLVLLALAFVGFHAHSVQAYEYTEANGQLITLEDGDNPWSVCSDFNSRGVIPAIFVHRTDELTVAHCKNAVLKKHKLTEEDARYLQVGTVLLFPHIPVDVAVEEAVGPLEEVIEELAEEQVQLNGKIEEVETAQEELARELAEEREAREVLETALATHVTLVAVQTTQLGEITTQLETAQADLHKLQQAVTELCALLRFAAIGFVLAFVALVSVLALSGRQQRKRGRELEERIAALEQPQPAVPVVP